MIKMMCPRVQYRMECPECGYPYSEAIYSLDSALPHYLASDYLCIETTISNYELAKYRQLIPVPHWQPMYTAPEHEVILLCDEYGNRWTGTEDSRDCGAYAIKWLPLPRP